CPAPRTELISTRSRGLSDARDRASLKGAECQVRHHRRGAYQAAIWTDSWRNQSTIAWPRFSLRTRSGAGHDHTAAAAHRGPPTVAAGRAPRTWGGSSNTAVSREVRTSTTSWYPCPSSQRSTPSTSTSGADAPAVTPTVRAP